MTTFRSTSRRLLAVALAIAAALTMAAGAAHSASAAPIVGPSGCRGDCGGGTLDCNRSDLDADVRAAYCDNVPTAEIDLSGQVVAQAPDRPSVIVTKGQTPPPGYVQDPDWPAIWYAP